MPTPTTPSSWRAPDLSTRWWPVFLRNLLVWRKLAVPSLLGNIAEPLMWLVAFGYGMGALVGQVQVGGQNVPVHINTVWQRPFCNLLHFEREFEHPPRRPQPRLLIVAPVSGHHATLLRGTVEAMLPTHDVYITDWIDAKLIARFWIKAASTLLRVNLTLCSSSFSSLAMLVSMPMSVK